jgi:hypothetical protein
MRTLTWIGIVLSTLCFFGLAAWDIYHWGKKNGVAEGFNSANKMTEPKLAEYLKVATEAAELAERLNNKLSECDVAYRSVKSDLENISSMSGIHDFISFPAYSDSQELKNEAKRQRKNLGTGPSGEDNRE